MQYTKKVASTVATSRLGNTANDGSGFVLDAENKRMLKTSEKLIPFHALDKVVVTESNESATKGNPFGCEGGGKQKAKVGRSKVCRCVVA